MPTATVNSFALTAREGRTREPLDILGAEVLVKLSNADSNGAAVIFYQTAPPQSGPPLHRHSREDEWFYVLDGEITAETDGQRSVLHAGGCAFGQRGTVHAFQNFGTATAHMLVMVTPGGFDRFFEELSSLNKGLSAPDLVRSEQLMNEYGIELTRSATEHSAGTHLRRLTAPQLQSAGRGRQPVGIKFQRSVKTRSGKPRALVSSIFFSSGLRIARRRCMVSLAIQPFSQEGKIAVTTG